MLDRSSPSDAAVSGPVRPDTPRWPLAFVGLGGLLGASGVGIGAAGAHGGGGDLAHTASEFLLVHASAIMAGAGVALALARTSALMVAGLGLLAVGAALFGGELACAALLQWRPVPLAAPTGGLCLIGGWLCLAMSAVSLGLGARSRPTLRP